MGEQHEGNRARFARVPDCSLNEWVVLTLLGENQAHGFALAKELMPDTDLGRILTIRRPLVYRALDRLVERGLAGPFQVEPGDSGPTRTVHRVTEAGAAAVALWLNEPVNHVRDVRVEFLAKLRLMERRSLSPEVLIAAQRRALAATLEGLINKPGTEGADVVDLWRSHSATSVKAFLDQLGAGS